MENNIRIGKDFNVQWAINKVVDGERLPYDLVGKELQLYIVNDNGRKEVAGWKVQGNVIQWTFLGKDQKRLGAYQLVLVENAGKEGMVTVDTCKAFNLVAHSCEENVDGGSAIVIETVTLESEVALAHLRGPQGEQGPVGPQGPQGPAGPSYDDTELRNAIAEIQTKDTQTDAKLTELSEKVENINPTPMVSVTYAELVALRDNGELVAGMQYRITDFVTTTAQENTRSAGHQFDVIVTADNENTLNEVARACLHDGDTYFSEAGASLAAWQIWYCLDNDAERFAWADTENGKGVIYRMIDEWNNDISYDFKNIMFVRYELEAPEEYIAEGYDSLWMQQLCNNVRANFDEGIRSFVWAGIADEDKLWEDDMSQILSHTTGENFVFFTFNTDEDTDASLSGGIHDNKMSFSQTLPNNVFFGNDCHSNSFGIGCHSNSFGIGCSTNSFGNGCHSNSFGNGCHSNSFGNDCYYISFRNGCYSNSFGNGCHSNSFGIGCSTNSFGNDCHYISFGNGYYSISFGNGCYYISFTDQNGIADNVVYNRLDDGVNNVELWHDEVNGNYGELKNYHICRGVRDMRVEIYAHRDYETTYTMTTDGELREFILGDL